MPNGREIRSISDSHRDAEKHNYLLLALEHATSEVRHMESEGHLDIDEVLDRLLPDLAKVLNAKQAFVALLREDEGGNRWFELTAVFPRKELVAHRLESSELLQQLIEDGKTTVIDPDPLGEKPCGSIPGLETFDATSAILVRMQTADQIRVVGICNKLDPDSGPYLTADGMALDNIVELVAIGARVGERRRRELEGIQKTTAAISAELDPDILLPMITSKTAEIFAAPATSLMLWDASGENLVIKASCGLSDEYTHQQRIPKEEVYAAVASRGGFRPLVTPDLRLTPFGRPDLIESEHLCSVLRVPLLVSDKLIGLLNIYSKDEPHQFSSDKTELAEIFANQAAIAVQNAQLRRRELESLQATSAATSATLDLDELLPMVTKKAAEVFAASATSLMLWDKTEENLVIRANSGLSKKYAQKQRVPKEQVYALAPSGEFQPVLIPNLRLMPFGRLDLIEREDLCTVLITPLLVSDRLIGVLNIYSKGEPRQFTPDEIELATIFANQVAIAIENARLYNQAAQRARNLATLQKVSATISSTLDLNTILKNTCRAAVELFGVNHSSLFLFEADPKQVKVKAEYPDIGALGVEIPFQSIPATEYFIASKEPMVVQESEVVNEPSLGLALDLLHRFNVCSMLIVPVVIKDKVIGAFSLDMTGQSRTFTQEEIELCKVFATQVAVAIENTSAYDAQRETKEYLDKLIASSLDGIIAVDVEGWVTIFNEGAEQILGYRAGEVLGKKKRVDELHGSLEIARTINRYLYQQGKLENYESTVRTKEGVQVPILLSATQLRDRRGNVTGSVGFFKDLRPLKKAEAKKAEAELKLLLDTVNVVAGTHSLDEGLDALANKMITGLMTTFCHIMLLDDTGQKLIVKAACPIPRPQNGGLKWEPGVGKPVDLSPMKHLLEIPKSRVFRKGEVLEGQDVVSHIQKTVKLEGSLESALVIPLKVGDKVFGICTLGEMRSWERSPFTKEKQDLALSLSTQAAVAVERAPGYELALERAKALYQLNEAGNAIASTLELDQVLNLIVQYGAQLLRAEVCSVFLVRREGYLSLEAGYGSPPGSFRRGLELEIRSGRGTGLTGHIAKVGELVNLHGEELLNHPAVRQPGPSDHLPSGYCTSLLAIPLKRKAGDVEEVIGLIKAENKKDSTGKADPALSFSNEDILILKTLANHATTAIENARLYESISQRFKAAELMACLGPLSSTWSHKLGGTTFNVLTDIASLRRYLTLLEVSVAHRSELQKILNRLESNAAVLTTIVPSLPTEDIEESVHINIVLDDLLRDLPARYPHVQVIRYCAELPPVRANRRGLTFVFEELISNAVRQMPKGGRLTFVGSVMGKQAVIEVTDTGPGIPDENIRSQIFEKRHVVGAQDTGFGLSLVKTALAMYNGDIELPNWENGCTFVVRLPLA